MDGHLVSIHSVFCPITAAKISERLGSDVTELK